MDKSGCVRKALRGRPLKLSQNQLDEVVRLHLTEGIPIREVARLIGVSHMTVWRALCRQIRGGDANG
ncbi:MAG: helix-turn-helix domain-containing protein [Candidatus Micrarchaeota archaeon]|nr:helix-turn-helix domain-containing protein [Candidatus Micrarchaeota archaeon]